MSSTAQLFCRVFQPGNLPGTPPTLHLANYPVIFKESDQCDLLLLLRYTRLPFAFGLAFPAGKIAAQQNPAGLALPRTAKVTDTFTPLLPSEMRLTGGMLGTRIDANEKNRMLKVDEDDMLDCFERRNAPHQDWQGEHVGKFLHAATLAWQNTGDPALKTKLDRVVARLLKTQEADGYLGTYPARQTLDELGRVVSQVRPHRPAHLLSVRPSGKGRAGKAELYGIRGRFGPF